MSICDKNPEDLFRPESAGKYKALHKDVWRRMLEVHHCIITLEKLSKFPFYLVLGPYDMTFWTTVWWNAWHRSVILLFGLLYDKGSDTLTIQEFIKRIRTFEWEDPVSQEAYQGELHRSRPEARLKPLRSRITTIRKKLSAHQLIDTSTGLPLTSFVGMSVLELRSLFEAARRQFDACSFGSPCATAMPEYASVDSSLDRLLKRIAKLDFCRFWKGRLPTE